MWYKVTRRALVVLPFLVLGFLGCSKTDDKQKVTLSAGSLESGGVVVFPDGTNRKFKTIQGEGKELAGGLGARPFVDYLCFYDYDKNYEERQFAFNELSRIKFEKVVPEDFKAVYETRIARKPEDDQYVKAVGTYPPFVELTDLSGRKEKLRTEDVTIIVTWEDALGRTRYDD